MKKCMLDSKEWKKNRGFRTPQYKHLFNAFLLTFSVFLTGCLETTVNYDLPFEEKPIALGFLDSVHGARVFVGKNVPIFSKDSSAVKNATVSLWANDSLIENLTFFEKNVFVSVSNFKIQANTHYYFKATTPLSKDSLISEKIIVPRPVPIQNARVQYLDQQKSRVNILLDFKDPDGFNAYVVYIQRYKKDTLFDEEIMENRLFTPNSRGLFTDSEFQGMTHTHKIEDIKIYTYINRRSIDMDKIKITLFNLSKPTYDLFKSLNTPEPTIGDPFFEPTIISNKVKNGLGIFGSYSRFTYELPL
jgi:hypothetical protein